MADGWSTCATEFSNAGRRWRYSSTIGLLGLVLGIAVLPVGQLLTWPDARWLGVAFLAGSGGLAWRPLPRTTAAPPRLVRR